MTETSKRVLVVGRDPKTVAVLEEVLTTETCCDSIVDPSEAEQALARARYALIIIDAVEAEYVAPIVAAAGRIPKTQRPLVFVLFDDALKLPERLDPRVVTVMIRRPMSEKVVREVLSAAIRRILAVGGEITLRRLREAGAVRPKHRRGRPHGVLVVDDDRAIRDLVAAVLRREGLQADTANDGESGIEALRRHTYAVLVLDLMMPKLSGWEVIGWLKSNPESRPRSVIVCTAADRGIFAELDPEVVNAIFVKPFDVSEIGAYVRAAAQIPLERDRRRRRVVSAPPMK